MHGLQVGRVPSAQIGLRSDLRYATAEVTTKADSRKQVVLEVQPFNKMLLTGVDYDQGAA